MSHCYFLIRREWDQEFFCGIGRINKISIQYQIFFARYRLPTTLATLYREMTEEISFSLMVVTLTITAEVTRISGSCLPAV